MLYDRKRSREEDQSFQAQFGVEFMIQTFWRPAALHLHRYAEMHGVPSESVEVLSNLLTPAWDSKMSQVRYGESDQIIDNAGTLQVTYVNTAGRWVAQGRTNLQCLDEKSLATICKDLYMYLAIENIWPVLLLKVCQQCSIDCPWVSKVVNGLGECKPLYIRKEAMKVIIELIKGNPAPVKGPNFYKSWREWTSPVPDSVPSLANITVSDPIPHICAHIYIPATIPVVTSISTTPVAVATRNVNRTSIDLSPLRIDFSNLSDSDVFRFAVAKSLDMIPNQVSVQTTNQGQTVYIDVVWSPYDTQPTPAHIKSAFGNGLTEFVTEALNDCYHGLPGQKLGHRDSTGLESEVKRIQKEISELPKYAEIKDQYKYASSKDVKIMSAVLLAEQTALSGHFFEYLRGESVIQDEACVLRDDGIMVRNTSANKTKINETFLKAASEHIQNKMGHNTPLRIEVKNVVDVYTLPASEDLMSVEESHHLIRHGNEHAAIDLIVARCKSSQLIIKSQDRYYSRLEDSLVFTEGEKGVKSTIFKMTARALVIKTTSTDGQVESYSEKYDKKMQFVDLVLQDERIIDNSFAKQLYTKSRGYMLYQGAPQVGVVYNYLHDTWLTFQQAEQKQLFFPCDTGRQFPQASDNAFERAKETLREIIERLLPDKDERIFFLRCIARAMAGENPEKVWYLSMFFNGQAILFELCKIAFGPGFVHHIHETSLLSQGSQSDIAQTRKWFKDHTCARLAYATNMSKTDTANSECIDGNMIQRLISANSGQQMSLFLNCLHHPSMMPPDAYKTMLSFQFTLIHKMEEDIEFSSKDELVRLFAGISNSSSSFAGISSHSDLEDFMQSDACTSAFTSIIFAHYTADRPPGSMYIRSREPVASPPQVILDHTQRMRDHGIVEKDIQWELFEALVSSGHHKDKVFAYEIRNAAAKAGMTELSDSKMNEYVKRVSPFAKGTNKPYKPTKIVLGNQKQFPGFSHLRLRPDSQVPSSH